MDIDETLNPSPKRRKHNNGSASPSRSPSPRHRSTTPPSKQMRGLSVSRRRERSMSESSGSSQDEGRRSERRAEDKSRSRSTSRRRRRGQTDSRSRSGSRSSSSQQQSHSRDYHTTHSRSASPLQSTHHHHHRTNGIDHSLRPNFLPTYSLPSAHTHPISQVKISPNGLYLASASADGTAKIWESSTGTLMDTLVGHMAGVSCLAWSPESDTLATGSDDKAIRLWDRKSGEPAHAAASSYLDGYIPYTNGDGGGGAEGYVTTGVSDIQAIAAAARGLRGTHSAAGARSSLGRLPLLGHSSYIYSLSFSPLGNILASGSYDEAVFLWDVRAGRLMRSLPAHSDPVSSLDFSLDGTLVVSCSTDGLIRVWDTGTGQCLRTLVYEDNPPVTWVRFSPNGRFVAAWSLDGCVRVWDYVNMPAGVKKTYAGAENGKFSIGGGFGEVRRRRRTSRWQRSRSRSVASEDAREAGTGEEVLAFIHSPSEDGDIVIWDVVTKIIVQRIKGAHDGVCFCTDVRGDMMVSCGQDGKINVFRHRPTNVDADSEVNGQRPHINGNSTTSHDDRTPVPVIKLEQQDTKDYQDDDDDDDEEQLHAQLNGHLTEDEKVDEKMPDMPELPSSEADGRHQEDEVMLLAPTT